MTSFYALCCFASMVLLWFYWWRYRLEREWWMEFPAGHSGAASSRKGERVSVIIPSRNEAARLPALLESLAHVAREDMEIMVVNDHSTDDTDIHVERASMRDPRVRLCDLPPKPDGWAGKAWAMRTGVSRASGNFFLFCDADMVLERDVVEKALDVMHSQKLEALSLVPRMEAASRGAALLLAGYSLARSLLFRPAAPGRQGLVQGGFLMMTRDVYARLGGADSVKGSLLEDVEWGWRMYRMGVRVRTYSAHSCLMTRMYDSFGQAWQGMCKHLYPVLRCSLPRMLGVVLLLVLALPVACTAALLAIFMAFSGQLAIQVGLAAFLLLALILYCVIRTVRMERLPLFTGVVLPWSILLLAGILAQSCHGYRVGKIVWKGRSYRAGQLVASEGV